MFTKGSDVQSRDVVPGITMKTTVFGDTMLMTEFHLQKGVRLPVHSHPQEQTGYLITGKLILTIDDREFTTIPGDSWNIPGDVMHCAIAVEESVAIEVFSPVREDYLP